MSNVPVTFPRKREDVIQGYFSLNINMINREYISIGKNTSFMCSHMDSFTGVKRPMILLFPVQSYKKWERKPKIMTKTIPIIVNNFNCLIIKVYADEDIFIMGIINFQD